MSGLVLRVVWPILDPAMRSDEAIADAALQWPSFAENYQVTVLELPRIRVEKTDELDRIRHRTDRVVVCEAPVIKRVPKTPQRRRTI
jgi:hypothetical protein